ncbi:hypothetical protein EBB07_34265 [Paenibacillaceae bacterium]|nr:hypothetical protein EBB07_34265 [Paenibacillaceae bacterium]
MICFHCSGWFIGLQQAAQVAAGGLVSNKRSKQQLADRSATSGPSSGWLIDLQQAAQLCGMSSCRTGSR